MRYWVDMTGFWLFFTDSGALGSFSADFLYGRNAERSVLCVLSFPVAALNAVMDAVVEAALMGVPGIRMAWMPGMACCYSLMVVFVSSYGMACPPSPGAFFMRVPARMPMPALHADADAADQPMGVSMPASVSVFMVGLSTPVPMGSLSSVMGTDAMPKPLTVSPCLCLHAFAGAADGDGNDAGGCGETWGCQPYGLHASRMTAGMDAHTGADAGVDTDDRRGGSMGIMDGSWTRIRGMGR